MKIDIETIEQVTLVRIVGALDGATAPQAQTQILPLIKLGSKILLDMSSVTDLTSSGLMMLLVIGRQVSNQNGRIALVTLTKEHKDIIEVTGLLRLFTTCETVNEGLKALK